LPHCGPGADSASDRNEHQEYFLGGKGDQCVRLTTLPPSCADCLEIWVPQLPGTFRACPVLYRACPVLYRACPVLYRACPVLYRACPVLYRD